VLQVRKIGGKTPEKKETKRKRELPGLRDFKKKSAKAKVGNLDCPFKKKEKSFWGKKRTRKEKKNREKRKRNGDEPWGWNFPGGNTGGKGKAQGTTKGIKKTHEMH